MGYTYHKDINIYAIREEWVDLAIEIMRTNPRALNADIVNPYTGEVLFSYERGNVKYIAGDFAAAIAKKKTGWLY